MPSLRGNPRVSTAPRVERALLGDVADELQRPTSALLSSLERVAETPLSAGQRRALEDARAAADTVVATLNDVGSLCELERGQVALRPANLFLRTVVADTLRALAGHAHAHGVRLAHDVAPEVPDALIGDVGRLRQLVSKLIEDAIQRKESGAVSLRVRLEPSGALAFAVEVQGSITRMRRGTCLAALIACRLVDLMEGVVTLDGDEICGFAIPFERQAEGARADGDLRVLVVDADPARRDLLESWLREDNVDATSVDDGVAAIDRLWEGVTGGRPYRVILVDADRRDSLALVSRVRGRQELAGTTIVALAASEPGRLHALGIDAFLARPTTRTALRATLRARD